MNRSLARVALITLAVILMICGTASCGDDKEDSATDESSAAAQTATTESFRTFEREGLFSITFPSDWVVANELIDDIWNNTIIPAIESGEIRNLPDDPQLLLIAGIPVGDGYSPAVSTALVPRQPGYHDFEEIVANEKTLYEDPDDELIEETRTTISERQALILEDIKTYPDGSVSHFENMFIVGDNFVFATSCGCDQADFEDNREDCDKIIRSFKVLE